LFPSAFGAIALAVLVYGQSAQMNPIAITLAVLALAAIMVRMALLLRETAALAVSRKLSLTDDLTGLGNRRSFTAEVANAIADGRPFALLMIDLDQFKELNDTLGHHLGDELLGRATTCRVRRRRGSSKPPSATSANARECAARHRLTVIRCRLAPGYRRSSSNDRPRGASEALPFSATRRTSRKDV
jgi:hypothetical protein